MILACIQNFIDLAKNEMNILYEKYDEVEKKMKRIILREKRIMFVAWCDAKQANEE